MVGKADDIYAKPLQQLVDFRFDERVVSVFPDMIQRSVPGYGSMLSMIGVIAGRYAQPDSYCYDLGCSLGAVTLAMRQHIRASGCAIVAVDNSTAMIDKARDIAAADSSAVPVTFVCEDILQTPLHNASVVVMNFTLQFIQPAQRADLIARIYQSLVPGGVLILSEKLAFAEDRDQQLLTELHHDFKRANGYSDLEISQKRSALENVLIPESFASHQQRLQQAGFSQISLWFQCFSFASMIAIK